VDLTKGFRLGRFEAASAAKEVGEDQVLTVVAALQVKDKPTMGSRAAIACIERIVWI
jgi:hypothetical protein